MKPLLRKFLPLLILLFAGLAFAYFIISKPTPQREAKQDKDWLIEVEEVHPSTYTPQIVLYGRVESPRTAEMNAALEADVLATPVLEGTWVKKDQVLIKLDDREAKLLLAQRQADVAELEAKIEAEQVRFSSDKEALKHEEELLQIAKKNVERRQHLTKTLAGSAFQYDQAREAFRQRALSLTERKRMVDDYKNQLAQLQAKLARAEALAAQAQLDYDRSLVKAPFAGRVAKVLVSVGERVREGEPLIKLFDTSELEIRAQVPVAYLDDLQTVFQQHNQLKAQGEIDGQTFALELVRVAGQVEQGRAGMDGLFKVTSSQVKGLALGRTIKMRLNLSAQNQVYSLPLQALYRSNTVYKVVDDRLQAATVDRIGTFAKEDGSKRMVVRSSDLHPGDQVMVTNLPNAIAGLPVSIKEN